LFDSSGTAIRLRGENMSSSFNHVTVLGAGVLGAQISFQIAYRGYEVTTYDVSGAALTQARPRFDGIAAAYPTEVAGATEAAVQETIERIRFTSELASAVQRADLVIEAVPENLELKRDVFARIAALAPPAAVVVTNSSTLVPSDLMDSTGRPDRFLALHFANHIWVNNIAEVMGSPRTDPHVYERVVAFAKDIGMVPIELRQEQPGYIVNSLLGPLLMAAAGLLLRGVADPATIDTTWRIATGAPKAPSRSLTSLAYAPHTPSPTREAGTVKPGPTTSRPTTSIKANWASNPAKASTHTRCHKRRADPSREKSRVRSC
jgi:3-hydroxyacyl-CoA dehydrogenase